MRLLAAAAIVCGQGHLLSNDRSEVRIHCKHERLQRISFLKTVRVELDALGIVNRGADQRREGRLNFSGSEVRGEEETLHPVEASVMRETEAPDLFALVHAKAGTHST